MIMKATSLQEPSKMKLPWGARILNVLRKLAFYIVPWSIPQAYYVRKEIDKQSVALLDVGCGNGRISSLLTDRAYLNYVGLDIFLPYLEQARLRFPRGNYILCDIRYLPIRDKTFDTVLSMSVLEHLEREEGLKLITDLQRVARRQVIVWIPIGFMESLEAKDNNPAQVHRSGWTENDMISLGFIVKQRYGFQKAWLRIATSRILSFIVSLLYPVIRAIPHSPGEMLCVKNINTENNE